MFLRAFDISTEFDIFGFAAVGPPKDAQVPAAIIYLALADIVFKASYALISLPSYLAIIAHFSISGIAPQTISIKSSSEFTASKICL